MLGLSQIAFQNIVFAGKAYEPAEITQAQTDAKIAKIWEKAARAWIPGLLISIWTAVCLPLAFMASWSQYEKGEPWSVRLIYICAVHSDKLFFAGVSLLVISIVAAQRLSRKGNHNEILADSKQAEMLKSKDPELFNSNTAQVRLQAAAAVIQKDDTLNDFSKKVFSIYFATLAKTDETMVKKYIDFSLWYQINAEDRSMKPLQQRSLEVKGEKVDTFLADFETALKA